ncbi:type II secretion system protein [Ideonella sp. DXS22W]|uniref:Type II secretion system protein n=1 Tax=Pseudaquabacterium inlustre TaxID=2984192 RepID=A0ABU9CL44_9BURK
MVRFCRFNLSCRARRGFTLIEQVTAIALLGIASAAAAPHLVQLHAEAQAATLDAMAHAASSAMAMNQAGCLVTGHAAVADKCTPQRDCADVGALLLGGLPEGYEVARTPLPRGQEALCTMRQRDTGAVAQFIGLGAGV